MLKNFIFVSAALSLMHCATSTKHLTAKQLGVYQKSWDGVALVYPKGTPEITAYLIEIPPGQETGWHKHPIPTIGYVFQGDLVVHLKDGRTHAYHPGDTVPEVVDTFHNGKNEGKIPVKILVFYIGEEGLKTTVLEP